MIVNRELDEILTRYDNYHSSIIEDNKIEININFKTNKIIDVIIVLKKKDEVQKKVFDFKDDFDFNSCILPKIVQRFFSKNNSTQIKELMGTNERGNIIVTRTDNRESLIIRNCTIKVMKLIKKFESICKKTSANNVIELKLNDDVYEKYLNYNIALDYAKYRLDFLDSMGKANFFDLTTSKSFLEKENRNGEKNLDNLILLDIARYAYNMGIDTQIGKSYNVFDEIELYNNDEKIKELCKQFRKLDYTKDSIAKKALICAEYEKNNEIFINNNIKVINEAIEAAKSEVVYGNDNFLGYWDGRRRYYNLIGNDELVKICNDFLNSSRLIIINKKEEKSVVKMVFKKKPSLISEIKKVNGISRPDFSSIINDPVTVRDVSSSLFRDEEHDQLAQGAEEQARKLLEIIRERDQIKKDAEDFAKIILKGQKERNEIIKAAQEQAKRIYELEKENEELKRLAEDNARSIFEREKKYAEEIKLREVEDTNPISQADIDKINNLLTALSSVKEIDFSINHPTIMQEIVFLEEKIVTYLSTHKNIVTIEEETIEDEEENVPEKMTPPELLEVIRNVYTTSHMYEKEGRHTLINIVPMKDESYKVTLYSVKNDTDDVLTEACFAKEFFKEDTIGELCNIFSKDAVLVASKTDNMPNGLADYLVIDNQDNAIKFMGCSKEIIEIAKAYL